MKNYNVLYGVVLRHLEELGCFEGGTGIPVVDEDGVASTLFIKLIRKVNINITFNLLIKYILY